MGGGQIYAGKLGTAVNNYAYSAKAPTMNQTPPITSSIRSKTSALAVTSLVLGILGLVLCMISPLFAIPAVICGHVALSKVKRSAGALGGRGIAIAGLITGYVGLALLLVLLPIAIPNFVKAREGAFKNACVSNLRSIDDAKQQWALQNSKKEDAVPTQDDIVSYVSRDGVMPVCPADGTYEIGSVGESPTCSVPEHELSH
jgi:hypothetical protein